MVDSDFLVGQLVADRYRIVRRLGAGGMGTVYVAIQEPLGREVALKVVRRELAGEKRALERFRREAVSLSQAHHPHIVTLHDFGELPSGALWFAMELVRGENLRDRLVRSGPLSVKKSVALVRDACAALAAAHALGIIHRDLKPENILLMEAAGRPDFVKLVDFGVAKLPASFDDDTHEQLTARGTVVGTPGYIAPEVALRDVGTDPRSDLYALGVVWFECLSGQPPFIAQTATALMMMHAVERVPPLPANVPLPVAGLVQKLLAKDPAHRPASAEALLALLDALPPFDPALVAPRPAVVPITPYEPTDDDNGPARVALANAETAAPTAATPSAETMASSSALTEGSLPVPRPLETTEPTARPAASPMGLSAGLVALVVALVVAAGVGAVGVAMAWSRTSPALVDAGAPSVVDVGLTTDAVVDAGVSTDAGVPARPRPQRPRKPIATERATEGTEPGAYEPDLD